MRRWALLVVAAASQVLLGSAEAQNFSCAGGEDAAVCAALGDFYVATNGPSWLYFTDGWLNASAGVPTSYCSFLGLTCNGAKLVSLCVPACTVLVRAVRSGGGARC